jgi:hypothetical protein
LRIFFFGSLGSNLNFLKTTDADFKRSGERVGEGVRVEK